LVVGRQPLFEDNWTVLYNGRHFNFNTTLYRDDERMFALAFQLRLPTAGATGEGWGATLPTQAWTRFAVGQKSAWHNHRQFILVSPCG